MLHKDELQSHESKNDQDEKFKIAEVRFLVIKVCFQYIYTLKTKVILNWNSKI